ncbi:MAG: ComEC/Rec2 family competence protein, partial [Minisyncoccia bacterium]
AVITEPDIKNEKILLTIKVRKINQQRVSGKVLVQAPLYVNYQYGQILEIECKLDEPESFGRFNYHEYLARFDIYSICRYPKIKILAENKGHFIYAQILKLKNKFRNLINQNFTEPQGAILSALTFGYRREIPAEVNEWFRRTGTSHIIAVSGMHVAIMTRIIEIFLINILYFSRKRAFYFSVLLIILYIILVGVPASAVRAGIMALMILYAKKIGRLNSSTNALVLVAALMLFQNPKLLKSDVGFQLSFTAILGMIYFENYFQQIFHRLPNWRCFPIRYFLSATLSAQIFTLPLILYYFGNLSLVAPLANILILPVLQAIMIGGFLFLLIGALGTFLAKLLAIPPWLFLTYLLVVIKVLANVPYLSYNLGQVHWLLVPGLYSLIIFWLVKIRNKVF